MKDVKVLTLRKEGIRNFAEARNEMLAKIKEPWVLVLDTDERLSLDLIKMIPTLLKNDEVVGYWFRRRWYWDKTHYLKHGLFYPDYQLRLFRNKPEYRYIHRVHEELTIPKEKTKQIKVDIYHDHVIQKPMNFYIKLATLDFKDLNKPKAWYLWKAVYTFIDMFFIALIRGKGILDGWIGIKAHYYFAMSISKAYWSVVWS